MPVYFANATCRRCGTGYSATSDVSQSRAQQGATNRANTCAQTCSRCTLHYRKDCTEC